MASPTARLGLWSASSLVIANMIGAGLFTTSGFALADLGDPRLVLVAWGAAGVLAMCGALSYGAFARRLPESGGEYAFLARTVHPLAGFLAGWVSLWAGFTAPIAAAGLGLQAYLGDSFGATVRPEWIGTAAIVGAGLLHGVRRGTGVALQNAAVALKLILIGGLVALGAARMPGLAAPLETTGLTTGATLGAFALSLVWISYAYSGWNAAVYVAGEVSEPRTNLPRALCLATAAVALLYLSANAVFLYSAPAEQLAGRADIAAVAAEALGGAPLRRAVAALVALALFTSISSMVMVGPRVYARMAGDGLFPSRLVAAGDAPGAAVALQVVLAVIVLWNTTLAELLSYIGLTLGLSASATVLALIALRIREGRERVPIPGYPWVPGVFVVGVLGFSGTAAAQEPLQAAVALLTTVAGVPIYFWMRAKRGGSTCLFEFPLQPSRSGP